MERTYLNGKYSLMKWDFGKPMDEVLDKDYFEEGWLTAQVPGDAHTALRKAGLIEGYYLGKQNDRERWIDECDWLWRRVFDKPAFQKNEKAILCFDGIDTIAEVWLNGTLLGKCDNMFIPWEYDVTELLREEDNVLVVRIISPEKAIADVDRSEIWPKNETSRMLLRKSQMNFAWDFCGHCLSGGIWQDVYIEHRVYPRMVYAGMRTVQFVGDNAEIAFWTEGENAEGTDICVKVQDAEGKEAYLGAFRYSDREQTFTLENVKKWWPRPYGEAYLYDVTITMRKDGVETDKKSFRFGARTVELSQEKLEVGGREFAIVVNGLKIFARGANWVPQNAIYTEIQDQQTVYFLRRAMDANITMLRIWGGGIYESKAFYDFCDANGILIMQDFMVACGIPPQDEAFLNNVENEVGIVVRRLYNHACIAVWSGDNEIDDAYGWYNMQERFITNKVNRVAVTNAVKRYDPYRPFQVSSPCSPFVDEEGGMWPNSPVQGDAHKYIYYKKIQEFVPRFMSEYGFSSFPCMDTYRRYNFFGQAMNLNLDPWFGRTPALAELAKAGEERKVITYTQFSHGASLKYSIEYMRSFRGICSGSLYWKFNDPYGPNRENMTFPTLMSAIDFVGQPKCAYYYSRRAYEDRIIAFREIGDELSMYLCNDTMQDMEGELTLTFMDFAGNEMGILKTDKITAKADGTTLLAKISIENFRKEKNGYFLARFGDLVNRFDPLDCGERMECMPPKTTIETEFQKLDDTRYALTIRTKGYVQDLWIEIPGYMPRFSDNGFCMDAGTEKTVIIEPEYFVKPREPEKIRVNISAINI